MPICPMTVRHRLLIAILVSLAALVGCGDDRSPTGDTRGTVVLATTTSTQDSGLLDVLVPAFERESGYRVKTIAVGSGQALEMGRRGEADVVLAHSPDAERKLMATGVAGRRLLVMHNDFVVVGPAANPARIGGSSAKAAFVRIADARAPFISRGDDSGTNTFELKLWAAASVKPSGGWYEESGQGMAATLRIADQKRAYTLADRGTYLATAATSGLKVLVQGGAALRNVYHVIDITKRAAPRVNAAGGRGFEEWIMSAPVQKTIGAFGVKKYGRSLFTPDAKG
jgi:tungstate transport system substrate-binding protein